MELERVFSQFKAGGRFVSAEPYGFGHINDTYAVKVELGDKSIKMFILQRINSYVFKEPVRLVENIEKVTKFIREIFIKRNEDPSRKTLTLVPTFTGKNFYIDEEGSFWRVYIFIERATSYQTVEKPEHFYHAGRTIGEFQKILKDYPAHTLHETIPDFHDTKKRFEAFERAIEADVMGRAAKVKDEIDFALARKGDAEVLAGLLKEGKLPLRVTHNDTKFNNVMIDDATGEGLCLIDLDTVMPGLSLYDFGDSIRSGCNPAAEDEVDLSKVYMDLNLYEHFTKGYLEQAGSALTETEIAYLPFSAKIMTFECGIRFLTDYLNGDIYFKIHRPDHNLDRCRTQFKLVADMEEKMEKMTMIVEKYIPWSDAV